LIIVTEFEREINLRQKLRRNFDGIMYGYMSIVMLLLVATCATLSLGHASGPLGGARPGVKDTIIEHIDTFDADAALLERFPQLTDRGVNIAEASQHGTHRKSDRLNSHRNEEVRHENGDLEARRLEMDHELRMQALIGDQGAKKRADDIRVLELQNEKSKRADDIRVSELQNEKSRLELYDNALGTVKMVVIGGVIVAAIVGGPPLLAAVGANSAAIVEIIGAVGELGGAVIGAAVRAAATTSDRCGLK